MSNGSSFSRRDFIINDVAVSIGAGGHAGTWLPGPDGETPPTPISPIAAVLDNLALIEGVRGAIAEAVKAKKFDDVARAFVPGDAGGNPAIRTAIHEIGAAVVASAAYAALGKGNLWRPDPNCGGTSLETIPPWLTPTIKTGLSVHRVSELPRLRKQLAMTLGYVEKATAAQMPQGNEVAQLRTQLEAALKSLPK